MKHYRQKLAYSIPEAASHLGISRSRLYLLLQGGSLKTFTIGKRRLVSHDSLAAFIKSREAA